MNILRNPWVSAALVIVAVVVIWRQLFPSRPEYHRPAESVPVAVATSNPSHEATPTVALPVKTTPPEPGIDRDYVLAHIAAWIALPARDPFQLLVPRAIENPTPTTESAPWVRWKLKAIWRQDGSSLAAINQGIYAEGDMIDGYRIDKIEDGHVWLQGPKLRERLTIDKLEPDADLNPVVPVPPGIPAPVTTNSAPTNSVSTNNVHAQ